ncbi:hypothetical protein AB0H37_34925 [Actinomadura sp. NPDC023710]|uniref:hypothetical protein n=1 Tax=Actinomadura sp. NPDC023710 TaxID=3158219 RepID=UPI0033F55A30
MWALAARLLQLAPHLAHRRLGGRAGGLHLGACLRGDLASGIGRGGVLLGRAVAARGGLLRGPLLLLSVGELVAGLGEGRLGGVGAVGGGRAARLLFGELGACGLQFVQQARGLLLRGVQSRGGLGALARGVGGLLLGDLTQVPFGGGLLLGGLLGALALPRLPPRPLGVGAGVGDLFARVPARGGDLLVPVGARRLRRGVGLLGAVLGGLGRAAAGFRSAATPRWSARSGRRDERRYRC